MNAPFSSLQIQRCRLSSLSLKISASSDLLFTDSFKSAAYLIPRAWPLISCLHFLFFLSFFPLLPLSLLTPPSSVFQSHVAAGSGEPGGDEYHSLVLYHNNSPRWAEHIKLPIPVDVFRGSHVRFEFRHCSSKWLQSCGHSLFYLGKG